jgi:predicted nuclease of predicted toxin-antitoxin system
MRFIVDESTGTAVVAYLSDAGHDVVAVCEVMPQASDDAILVRALAEGRIVVTNDKDFGELAFRWRQRHAGVILLRSKDDSANQRVQLVKTVLEQFGDQLEDHFTVVTERTLRMRPMRRL